MSAAALFALVAIGVCLLVLILGAIVLGLQAAALTKHARKLETHPTLVAARRAPQIAARLKDVGEELKTASKRMDRLRDSVAKILSSAALIGLNVDRVAFATKLFLSTFVPTLSGLMADD